MRVLRATLSERSLEELERAIRAYADEVEAACPVISDSLAEIAAETARAACPVRTGALYGSISAVSGGDGTAEAVAASEHAAFVEFGTGVVGAASPSGHAKDSEAMARAGYVPDGTGHGEAGWVYPGDDGALHWTKGQPGRGFMAAGAEEARSRLYDVARGAMR